MEKAMMRLSNRSIATHKAALALLAAFVLGLGSMAAGEPERASAWAAKLPGTWRVQVTTHDCSTGVPLMSFPAKLTFVSGGTVTGTTAARLFQPGQRTPDHGVWSATGRRRFHAVTEAFILFDSAAVPPAPPLKAGIQRITQEIEMSDHDEFNSDAKTEFFDLAGNLVLNLCATAYAERMEP
jgi:hypothetical protein